MLGFKDKKKKDASINEEAKMQNSLYDSSQALDENDATVANVSPMGNVNSVASAEAQVQVQAQNQQGQMMQAQMAQAQAQAQMQVQAAGGVIDPAQQQAELEAMAQQQQAMKEAQEAAALAAAMTAAGAEANTTPDTTPQVDYNNTMPGASGSTQEDVALPDTPSAITDKNVKVQRPIKRYKYTIINTMGKKELGTFDAESENDVRNFLLSQNYQVLDVSERSKYDIDIGGNGKINAADLSFSLTQLSTYIRAGIPLADSVRILAKQTKRANLKKSFNQLVYELLRGESLSTAMEMQGAVYPKLLVNMVKTAEMTGDLPSILDDMSDYYTSMEETRKQMKSAMTYPVVVLTIAFGVLIFMLTFLVPQFTAMFEENGAELPKLTQTIVAVSHFLKVKWYILLIVIASIITAFYMLYTKVEVFKEKVQIILMHTPVFKNIIIYNEIANFTKTFASLLNHGVFITDSMEILSKITSNEVYKKIIGRTLENLGKGDSISSAFKGQWAIPVVAYEMIVTGESTGQLGQMMEKVAGHFQMLHKNVIDQMKSLIEPILICFLAVVVGIILISIIQPMFSIYSQVK